jgi:hypothetical protein
MAPVVRSSSIPLIAITHSASSIQLHAMLHTGAMLHVQTRNPAGCNPTQNSVVTSFLQCKRSDKEM